MSRALAMTIAAVLALAALAAASLAIGPVSWHALDHTLLLLRLTRVAAGITVGAALAGAGVLMQGLFRNPLASPAVLGVSEGAGLAMQIATLSLVAAPALLPAALPPEALRPLAGLGGAAGVLAIVLLAARRGAGAQGVLLIGLILALFFSALSAGLLAVVQDRWEMGRALIALNLGGIADTAPIALVLTVPLVAAGLVMAWRWAPALDVQLTGEEEAAALGLDVPQLRRWVLVWAAVLTSAAVSLGGGVAFVGLVVPNLVRLRLGPGHRPLLGCAALGGAAFVTGADCIARLAAAGAGELPLGVVTSLVGAPVFLWLLWREQRAGRA